VILWLALRRLLPLLAVLSLALLPVAAPAAVAGMHAPTTAQAERSAPHEHGHAMAPMDMAPMDDMAGAAMDAMPCCPPEAAAPSDQQPGDGSEGCLKGCPLMALCLAGLASLPPSGIGLPVPFATGAPLFARKAARFASVTGTPPPEPPRA
jgi:hypothetical protein